MRWAARYNRRPCSLLADVAGLSLFLMMNLSSRGRSLLLALLLTLVQLGAFTHALGHLKEGGDAGRAAETVCEWCAAYAQTGNALPSGGLPLPLVDAAEATSVLPLLAPLRTVRFHAYLSQAPPRLS